MKTFTYRFENTSPLIDMSVFGNIDDLLFFDIETTGLSPSSSFIYMIGVGYYKDTSFNIVQWFAENSLEESKILSDFYEFIDSFTSIIHFNGQMFDIPFVEKRSQKLKIECPISEKQSFDIYKIIKPYKTILGLQDLKQKTLESFLGINRDDLYSGGELIPVYKKYSMHPNAELLDLLLLHNKEDVFNMTNLLLILEYRRISDIKFKYNNLSENIYKDYNNNENIELLITGTYELPFKNNIRSIKNNIYLNLSSKGTFSLRIPVINDELKYFFKDTSNYYYMPELDCAVHKSVASGVDKSRRKPANKNNCYIRTTDSFVQCSNYSNVKVFKKEPKSKECYCTCKEFLNLSDSEKSEYITQLIQYVFLK